MEICRCEELRKIAANTSIFTVGTNRKEDRSPLPEGCCIMWLKNSLGKFDVRVSYPRMTKRLQVMTLLGGRTWKTYDGGVTSIKYIQGKFPYG